MAKWRARRLFRDTGRVLVGEYDYDVTLNGDEGRAYLYVLLEVAPACLRNSAHAGRPTSTITIATDDSTGRSRNARTRIADPDARYTSGGMG